MLKIYAELETPHDVLAVVVVVVAVAVAVADADADAVAVGGVVAGVVGLLPRDRTPRPNGQRAEGHGTPDAGRGMQDA